jgi:lipopolysaccharide/colanic/teichoic acid biosynthesis glycosyltransferase
VDSRRESRFLRTFLAEQRVVLIPRASGVCAVAEAQVTDPKPQIVPHDLLARWISAGLSLVGGAALSPLLATTAVVVRFNMGSPVLFRQQRVGLHGKLFEIVKFRTMKDAVDASGQALPDSERLTKFGAFLRSTSIDELPELWNVVKGDMNLVGPRPLLPEYLPLYNAFQARRHEVRPGITGWAAIKGRNRNTWDAQFEMDVWYVDNRSLVLDLKILALTVLKVLRRDDIAQDGQATRERFMGNSNDP